MEAPRAWVNDTGYVHSREVAGYLILGYCASEHDMSEAQAGHKCFNAWAVLAVTYQQERCVASLTLHSGVSLDEQVETVKLVKRPDPADYGPTL